MKAILPLLLFTLTFSIHCTRKSEQEAIPEVGPLREARAIIDPESKLETIGNPAAPQGGTFYWYLPSEPDSMNPVSSTDYYSRLVQEYVMDGLMILNYETYEFEPGLAERYEMSEDGLTYTFYLREGAVFHDGSPLTAEDVKFSFDSVKQPEFRASHRIPYYENIESVEAVDAQTVRIKTSNRYYGNFPVMVSIGFTPIVPKHFYGDPEQRRTREMLGSGPYKVERYNTGRNMVLARNEDWWGNGIKHLAGRYNFDRIFIRFVREENLQIEMLRKGQLDMISLGPEAYNQKTEGEPFGSTVLKKKVENSQPKGYSFIGWNLQKPLFQDVRVRRALAHLLNRDMINEMFRFGMSHLATGPWDLSSMFADPNVKPLTFDLDRAKALLKEAGWEDKSRNGILEKEIDGRNVEFRFTLLLSNRDVEKYFTVYREDLKKAGIDMTISLVEWNSFVKALDERNFDAVTLGWSGGSVDLDPKQIWHSESSRGGGSNFISYNNPEVDRLIDSARELEREQRIPVYQKVYRLIAEDAPYTFMFVDRYVMYGHNIRVEQSQPTFKYNIGRDYWYMSKDL